mmetsp:Transcript_6368/g.21870  ORF Transcript_6368/g.21870 Transcript_6368/m.21870 type:complete len:240 (+) Transcript_6368:1056-1775(+)
MMRLLLCAASDAANLKTSLAPGLLAPGRPVGRGVRPLFPRGGHEPVRAVRHLPEPVPQGLFQARWIQVPGVDQGLTPTQGFVRQAAGKRPGEEVHLPAGDGPPLAQRGHLPERGAQRHHGPKVSVPWVLPPAEEEGFDGGSQVPGARGDGGVGDDLFEARRRSRRVHHEEGDGSRPAAVRLQGQQPRLQGDHRERRRRRQRPAGPERVRRRAARPQDPAEGQEVAADRHQALQRDGQGQ